VDDIFDCQRVHRFLWVIMENLDPLNPLDCPFYQVRRKNRDLAQILRENIRDQISIHVYSGQWVVFSVGFVQLTRGPFERSNRESSFN